MDDATTLAIARLALTKRFDTHRGEVRNERIKTALDASAHDPFRGNLGGDLEVLAGRRRCETRLGSDVFRVAPGAMSGGRRVASAPRPETERSLWP